MTHWISWTGPYCAVCSTTGAKTLRRDRRAGGPVAQRRLRRVKRLEDSGVIDRYVALVKPEAVGLGLTAYLNVRLEKRTETHKRNPWTCSAPVYRPGPGWSSALR